MLRYYPKRTGSAFTSANTETWNYNAKGEVVTANHSNNAFDRSFEFDGIGNRKKSADSITLPTADNYVANTLNQLTSANGGARIHDADGNLIDDGAKLFVWDAENRLIEIKLKSDDSTVATYAYDYQSRRITKTVGSTVTNFVYDGWNPIAEYTSALSPLSFTLSTSYTWGMDLSGSMQGAGGVGGLLSVNDGSATYYPTFDGNGNVSEYVDATGNVVAHYEYGAFGQVVASGAKSGDFTHQFSTKQLDSESDLHYYGYRYYDSSNGRWINRDPIAERGGLNIYGFVGNSGVNGRDYLGMYTIFDAHFSLKQLGVEPLGGQNPLDQAGTKSYSDKQAFDEWYRLEKARGNWWSSLPKCPRKLCKKDGKPKNPDEDKWKNPQKPSGAEEKLHQGTKWSMRSKPVGGSSNQCTYGAEDNGFYKLLTSPPSSGTVDYKAPSINTSHYNHDVAPVFLAAKIDGQNISLGSGYLSATPTVMKYLEVRPLHAE